MASTSALSSSSSQSRSHVVVLTIPDHAIEDVSHILECLRFHRGWSGQVVSSPDQRSATQVAEQCESPLLEQSSSPAARLAPSPFQYPATERDVSLLIPDRADAQDVPVDSSSRVPGDVMAGPRN